MAPKSETVGEGEFAGWQRWLAEPFEDKIGPFHHRIDESGRFVAAFRADRSHTNGLEIVHGGCLLAFMDYALFALAARHCDGQEAVTVAVASEFIGAGRIGDLILAYPEIVRLGGRLIFMRGLVRIAEKPVLSFSGTLMRVPAPAK
ncbi:MAG: PaaI family thioesterase [Alphaproteobacteria bacterium]|nr:PaaI family thioesterase [Alphaproteobacteria bacterium]